MVETPRFIKLQASAAFEMVCDPKSSIYTEIGRDYSMAIYALVGEVDEDDWETPSKVGGLKATQFRFDTALNLGVDPVLPAEAHSAVAREIFSLLEGDIDRGDIDQGLHGDSLLLHSIDLPDDLKGTRVELDAISTALTGLSSGMSRAFLQLNAPDMHTAEARNQAALRFAPLGFRPVGIGSALLWVDLDSRAFWDAAR